MKIQAIKCPNCGDIIYSLHRHDFQKCKCGKIYIDGGFDYTRIGCSTDIDPHKIEYITIKRTKKQLDKEIKERDN